MNRLVTLLTVFGAVFIGIIAISQVVQAQTTLPEEHIQRIRQNCVTAQTALNQLHASDALLRVNRGKLYENISTKLMAPLNSRIALNREEGLRLAATTLEYDRQIDIFRSDYINYERSMSNILEINCVDKPVEFYEGVQSTREMRQRLHGDTETLTMLLQAYKTEFEDFAKDMGGGS